MIKDDVMSKIKEDLMHYLWHTKAIDVRDLISTQGADVEILSYGQINHHDGPDFKNARIKIGKTIWAGHVEMHLRSSDWIRHNHHTDPGYQNVILHVVMEADMDVQLEDGTILPSIEIQYRISSAMIAKYQYLQNKKDWIPCLPFISEVSRITKEAAKERALVERLAQRSADISMQAEDTINDLNEVIYRRLAWAWGLKANTDNMLQLAQSVPYQIVAKHRDQVCQIEAILFGNSGLIDSTEDKYTQELLRDYHIYKNKYQLKPLNKTQWKFAKLRPPSFPTIRIAQFAHFLNQNANLSDLILEKSINEIKSILSISLSDYWKHHYRFGKRSVSRIKKLGLSTQNIIIANAIIPLIYFYGVTHQDEDLKVKAIRWLEDLPAEHNSITNRWEQIDMKNDSMADSQSLLQLKKHYCNHYRCLSCPIGHKVMSS